MTNTLVDIPNSAIKTKRVEHDFLGEREISNDLYYGIQTLRALENFNITSTKISQEPLFVKAFAYIKKAAAFANRECGVRQRGRKQ